MLVAGRIAVHPTGEQVLSAEAEGHWRQHERHTDLQFFDQQVFPWAEL